MIPPLPATSPTRLLRSVSPLARLTVPMRFGAEATASRRLGAMVEASGVVTLLCDANGLAVHVLDASGDACAASVGTSLWSWIHPDNRAEARTRWLAAVSRGTPFDMEWRTAGPHDPPRSAKFRVAPVPDDAGDTREWLVTLADVTEVRLATAELQRQRELSRSVIAASRDGILAFGLDHIALEWNASFERLAHAPHARVAAVPWTSLFPFAAPSALLARASLMLEDGQPFLHQETFGDAALDMARVLEFDFSPVHDSSDETSGGMCQIRDVTERLLLDGRQIQTAKMDSMGLLAAGIAHDFNNSLAAMMGLAELIELDLPADSPALESARDLMTSAMRARDLVRQILAFARQEPVRLVPIDLRDTVTESLRLMRKLLPKNIDVQVDLPPSPVVVHADAAQLQQIIVNLCTNAEHAMRGAATGALHVSLDVQLLDGEAAHQLPGVQCGAHAVLTVSDTGAGMSAETLARIFEPFFTTKAPSEGTGMGLAMVQQIAASHRGGFAVDSTPGIGTSMRLYLPLANAMSVTTADVGSDQPTPVGRGTVLILDDEPLLAQLLADALVHFGFRTHAFVRADDALAAFEAHPETFDAVITDHGMPGMTGDLFAERILARCPTLPVILLTGYAPPISPERARSIGITDVVTKPVSFRVLAQILVARLAVNEAAAANETAAIRLSA
jgi:signal transduction histidine kinase/CheY-like chemotaxis protein